MAVIDIDHVTKDYGHKRGIFDVSFSVKKGEVELNPKNWREV
ncbi:hypothetical protein [Weissella fangxianensis]|nr:hypothetical protein [Weissella fangxianensis]